MDRDSAEDATQMEINICNTDATCRIVLNDLQLLEQLYSYPFLLSKSVHGYGDKDYEEWAWQQIVRNFNQSYTGLELNTPFTMEELQWRWEVLKPICPSLGKACGQIPDKLWYTICKINRLMVNKLPGRVRQTSAAQKLILCQLPMMEQLTEAQQRRLEVEVLDAILTHERSIYLEPLNDKTEHIVKKQYDGFLKALRIKELQPNSVTRNETLPLPIIVNSSETNLVISNVCRLPPEEEEEEEDTSLLTASELDFKAEPYQLAPAFTNEADSNSNSNSDTVETRFVPLKSAKYYIKKLRVKVKRLNLAKYKMLAKIKE